MFLYRSLRLREGNGVFEAAHEPLVDEELFRLAQKLLAVRGESMAAVARLVDVILAGVQPNR